MKGIRKFCTVMTLSRLTAVAIFIWLILLLYISTVLVKVQYSQTATQVGEQEGATREATALEALERIKQASRDIEALKKQNEELKQILYESSNQMARNLGQRNSPKTKGPQQLMQRRAGAPSLGGAPSSGGVPLAHQSGAHEHLRRQISNGIEEFWYSISSQLNSISTSKADKYLSANIEQTLHDLKSQHSALKRDIDLMGKIDGAENWRSEKLANLSGLVQRRLDWLQNPENCSKARKLLCNLNKGCGFGCQLHHAAYCFMVAYGTKRTLILETQNWRYAKQRSWSYYFQPVSRQCQKITDDEKDAAVIWSSCNQTDQFVQLPIVDALRSPPDFLPLSFPEDLSKDLLLTHGAPPVWWVQQFITYLLRPSSQWANEIRLVEQGMQINESPIVGVHVRRTDKVGAEAAFHAIEEYMKWVENWFQSRELIVGQSVKRRIYLATDDTELLAQTRLKYPSFEVLGDSQFAASAQLNRRYTDDSLKGVLLDIHMLSKCDYLVCTFSSQVCRSAYEMMQQWRGDAADRFHSLDDIYYFGGQQGHEQVAWTSHHPRKERQNVELEFEKGDTILVAGNHWDGSSKGKHQKTGKIGLYPSYKVREKWRIVKTPLYEEVS